MEENHDGGEPGSIGPGSIGLGPKRAASLRSGILAWLTAEPRDRMTWVDRITGAAHMPLPMLHAARLDQLRRAQAMVPFLGGLSFVIGTFLLLAGASDPTSWPTVTWAVCLAVLTLWFAIGMNCLTERSRLRRFILRTAWIQAVGTGLVWGGSAFALAPASDGALSVILLGSAGVLLFACLTLAVLPTLAITLCAVGSTSLLVTNAFLTQPGVALPVGILILLFTMAVPLHVFHSAAGMMRRQQEGFLTRERHETARYLLENHEAQGTDTLWECDANHRMVRPSRKLCEQVGYPVTSAPNVPVAAFLGHAGVTSAGLAAITRALDSHEPFEDLRVEMRGEHRGVTRTAWCSVSGRPRIGSDGEFAGFVGIARDVTAELNASRELVRLTERDRLTGLANRHFFHASLESATQRAAMTEGSYRFAVLVLDMERFRSINETFGHATGDSLLRAVSERAAGCLGEHRPHAYCLARMTADEFALLLDDTGKAGAARMAAAICEAMSQPFDLGGRTVRTNARIGISLAPSGPSGTQEVSDGAPGADSSMLQRAELALSHVKSEGRGSWRFFETEMDLDQRARLNLERDLAEHIETDRCDERFELLYQPLVEPHDGRPVGMEALIRWNHPQLGTVSPATFIPMAERLGLIERIGRWSLATACREATRWGGSEAPRVAVNISAPHFAGGQLVEDVREALRVSGLVADRLEIEVTESVLLDEVAEAERTLGELNALGVHVALDDFGTGYSSLGYLQSFPFDKLKIDRHFVVSGEQDHRSRRILKMIVDLGRALDMRVVAEGIETHAQARMAAGLGCDLLQGYLFARPLPARDARALIAADIAETQARDDDEVPPKPSTIAA